MTVIVDTSVWIDLFRRRESVAASEFERLVECGRSIAVTDIVYAELLAGGLPTTHRSGFDTMLRDGQVLRLESIDDFERAAACRVASARSGRMVRSLTDCLIASVCIREGIPLLHRDRDFDVLAACTDLQVVTP